ncbi:MAG: hypothetical protein EHM70_17935, partial [Chloroflexota bacterium]
TAVRLIERHGMDMLMQWHVKTVEGWMRAIPTHWCEESPQANLAFAWLHILRGNPTGAFPYLGRLQGLFSDLQAGDRDDDALQAKWLALQSMLLNAQGKPDESVALGRQALEIAPKDDLHVLSLIYLGLAGAYQQLDDYDQAVEACQYLIQHGRAADNSVSELLGISSLGLLALVHGQYHLAFEIVSPGLERVERSGSLPPICSSMYGELGVIYYQWHQLELAHKSFRRAIQISTLSGYSDAELYYAVILSRLFQIQGDVDAAAAEIQKAVDLMQVEAPAAVREEVISQHVRVLLAQGHLARAEAALKPYGFTFQEQFSYPGLKPDQPLTGTSRENTTRPVGVLYLSALRILLYCARDRGELGNLQPGIELAGDLITEALQRQYVPLALEALLLRAQMQGVLGNNPAGLADVARAVELAEPGGLVSIFVEEGPFIAGALEGLLESGGLGGVQPEYVRSILAAFSKEPSTKTAAGEQPGSDQKAGEPAKLIEPLTGRELDVLRLVAMGLTYNEIANQLYISVNTVRSHVKALYGKLGADNRTRAIEIARQLQLL